MPLLILIAAICTAPDQMLDFASGSFRESWLRHPVLGDASFDSFEHAPGNPVHRGASPYEWPVNGFLFEDPVSSNWYLYVGEYCDGYALKPDVPARCVALRSTDKGATWTLLGPVLHYEGHRFTGETSPLFHAPDVSVVYADGRYHMCYDWTTQSTTWENVVDPGPEANSGVGYAWSDRPEGPFHPTDAPLATTREQVPLLGKYRRLYASTLIRRANDWLVLTLTDSGPNFGWALAGMTAANPEGPYTEPRLLMHPECDGYHPPLLEFFPAFVHEGYIYSPATSVALNRNYQALFRAPIEEATDPKAWELITSGSLWHAEPLEHETFGIWGQTFSGFVDSGNTLHVMFPSRDSQGKGTINLAHRPWDRPFREQGFVTSGNAGSSLVLADWCGALGEIDVEGKITGTVSLVWDYTAPLGADSPRSNATLHPLVRTRHAALRCTPENWFLESFDAAGERTEYGSGALTTSPARLRLSWLGAAGARLEISGEAVWHGALPRGDGLVGVLSETNSHASIEHFRVLGERRPSVVSYLYTDALLGAAQNLADWKEIASREFRFGVGAVSDENSVVAKWNVEGNAIRLWAPKGPSYGTLKLLLDGQPAGEVSCHAEESTASAPLLTLSHLEPGPHPLVVRSSGGPIPLDSIEVFRELPASASRSH